MIYNSIVLADETKFSQRHFQALSVPLLGCGVEFLGVVMNVKKIKGYHSWRSMKGRCLNPNATGYKNYGGRGIKVCRRWMVFKNFIDDMGEKPNGLSLDRINTNGNYSPKNCRWANIFEQNRNKRNVKIIEFDGKKMTIKEWAKLYNIPYVRLWDRLSNLKWNIKKALTTPLKGTISHNGKTMTTREWCEHLNISMEVLHGRLFKKWTIDRVLSGPIGSGSEGRLIKYKGKEMNLREWAEYKNIPYSTLKSRLNRSKWIFEKAITEKVKQYQNSP